MGVFDEWPPWSVQIEEALCHMRQLSSDDSDILPMELRQRLGLMPWQKVQSLQSRPIASFKTCCLFSAAAAEIVCHAVEVVEATLGQVQDRSIASFGFPAVYSLRLRHQLHFMSWQKVKIL